MKRRVLVVMLLALLSLAGCSIFLQVNVTGIWEGTLTPQTTGNLPVDFHLYLAQSGNVVTGHIVVHTGLGNRRYDILTGMVDGEGIFLSTFRDDTSVWDEDTEITLTGRVSGTRMTGTYDKTWDHHGYSGIWWAEKTSI